MAAKAAPDEPDVVDVVEGDTDTDTDDDARATRDAAPRVATTWYAPNEQAVHADTLGPACVYAAGATAGVPGSWTPAGSVVPASQTAVIQGKPNTIVATPATGWTVGQYVQTLTAGVGGRVYWNSTVWVAGAAP